MHTESTTLLDASPERVWDAVRRPVTLRYVAAPLLTFEPLDPPRLPEEWADEEYVVRLRLFGVVPLGTQTVRPTVERADGTPGRQFYHLRDAGSGRLASTWDHHITLRETPDGKTVYTDSVIVDAGVLTPLVWLFAVVFYRYRQHRWRRLVAEGVDALG